MPYVVNPTTGRSIKYGGALHRRLIKEGKMKQEIFETSNTRPKPKDLLTKAIKRPSKVKTKDVLESKEFKEGLIDLIQNIKISKQTKDGRNEVPKSDNKTADNKSVKEADVGDNTEQAKTEEKHS